jgi:hypothetical protein
VNAKRRQAAARAISVAHVALARAFEGGRPDAAAQTASDLALVQRVLAEAKGREVIVVRESPTDNRFTW